MSAIEDFAKRPNSYKAIVFGVIALVLGMLYFQFLWKPASAAAAAAESDYTREKDRRVRLEREEKEYRQLLAENDQIVKTLNDLQRALPTEAELPAFFDSLSRRISEAGVEIKRWNQLKEDKFESFVKVPVDIEVQGSFYKLKRFFASLAKQSGASASATEQDRIITIQNLEITEPKVVSGELMLTAKFMASTFREDSAGAAAASAKDTKKAAKPAAGAKGGK